MSFPHHRLEWAPRRRRLAQADGSTWLVPADLHRVDATLRFDAARQTANGEATIHFQTAEDGWPMFDLRQAIRDVRLDGAAETPDLVAPVRVGRLAEHDVRAIRRKVTAGQEHSLGVAYPLGPPRASGKGTYQPGVHWRSGGVHFNFGFTDLGGGRYLEAWVPANFIFDEFHFTLDIGVTGTAVRHVLITNGEATVIDTNRWRVTFPVRHYTALSPLVELHPASAIESGRAEARLPESGETVRIEAHKFVGDPVDVAAQLDHIARWLVRNEQLLGPYVHGGRYTAFLHIGGMEYDGACTSSADALEHEVFHSWWARGLKPASQNDGWIDEALAVYFDNGGDTRVPFDFSEPPVTLSSANRWNRATPIAAYRQGFRFVQGLAASFGVDRFHALLREFYCAHAPGLVATAEFEQFWIAQAGGDEEIRRAFARWVYGRGR